MNHLVMRNTKNSIYIESHPIDHPNAKGEGVVACHRSASGQSPLCVAHLSSSPRPPGHRHSSAYTMIPIFVSEDGKGEREEKVILIGYFSLSP